MTCKIRNILAFTHKNRENYNNLCIETALNNIFTQKESFLLFLFFFLGQIRIRIPETIYPCRIKGMDFFRESV